MGFYRSYDSSINGEFFRIIAMYFILTHTCISGQCSVFVPSITCSVSYQCYQAKNKSH